MAVFLLLLEGALLAVLLDEELLEVTLLLLLDGALLTLLDVELLVATLLRFLEGACRAVLFEVLRCGLLYVWVLRVTFRSLSENNLASPFLRLLLLIALFLLVAVLPATLRYELFFR